MWNPQLYLTFATERTQPAIDLASRVQLSQPARIVDLGCGPGNSTAVVRQRWPAADITGVDSSASMLAAAADADPTGRWLLADAATWEADEPYDVVFSNAALQWLPDHAHLFPRLLTQVAAGGALAVQIPAHYDSPVHQVVRDIAAQAEWRHLLDGASRALTAHDPAFYYQVLQPVATRLELWVTAYYHIMDNPQAILTWFRSTGLRPYLEALATGEQRERFEQAVLAGYTRLYPPEPDGHVLFPFKRLFLIAYR